MHSHLLTIPNMKYSILKRTIDILVSSISLVILLPVFLVIIFLLKFTGEGKVFFSQKRVGLNNKSFSLWKFTTMFSNSPKSGAGFLTVKNDPRVTPLGHFLRNSKLDEIPQLFLVLKGDISLVGPRPVVKKLYYAYPKNLRHKIYKIKPGVTGIGSIAFRNEGEIITASGKDPQVFYREAIAPYKAALELWYQEHASFFTDFKILFLTAWVIVFPKSELVYKVFKNLPEWKYSTSKKEEKDYSRVSTNLSTN